MTGIQDVRMGPLHGHGNCLVIFFHGYDSNGGMMAGHVGTQLAAMVPDAIMRFPDAPLSVPRNEYGRSWFPVEDILDGPDGNIAGPRAASAAGTVNDYIDRVMMEEGMPASRVIIAGFSQGATMAYFASLMREDQVAGVFSISGGALDQLAVPRAKPPVMLLAGEWENSLYSGRELADKTHWLLKERNFSTGIYLTPGNKHNIDTKSIEVLSWFVKRMVPRPAPAQDYALAM